MKEIDGEGERGRARRIPDVQPNIFCGILEVLYTGAAELPQHMPPEWVREGVGARRYAETAARRKRASSCLQVNLRCKSATAGMEVGVEAALRITKLDPDGTGAALPKDAEPGAEPHWQLPSTGQLHRRRF